MPPLYGEGPNAFYRLQLEMESKSDDESMFAWKEEESLLSRAGLLARPPMAFRKCGNLELGAMKKYFDLGRPPYSEGLSMERYFLTFAKPYLNH
jgi:hypothetical protein